MRLLGFEDCRFVSCDNSQIIHKVRVRFFPSIFESLIAHDIIGRWETWVLGQNFVSLAIPLEVKIDVDIT